MPSRASTAAMSGPRARVLELLQDRGRPLRTSDVAADLDLHHNTAREHLEALVAEGHATRQAGRAEGRGRPARLYRAREDRPEPDPRVREYAALAEALSAHIAHNSTDPAGDARRAGASWGRSLASQTDAGRGKEGARRAVIGVLGELGFDPQPDRRASTAALRRCPLLDVARRYPDVVCGVHLGLVRGLLRELGGDPDAAELVAFAEPGACRLTLGKPR